MSRMLRSLTVRNLAIVDDLTVELGPGLTVVTGETGAGKSILVDALALLVGGRGSADLVRHGADRLLVAGIFDSSEVPTELRDIAPSGQDGELVLRREFSSDGRGRAFVSDAPVAVRTLGTLATALATIHGQSEERELLDPEAPLELLDSYGGLALLRRSTAEAAGGYREVRSEREELEAARRNREARLDLLRFQCREIDEAGLDGLDEDAVTSERNRLLHADRIQRLGALALAALSEDEGSAADRLGEAARAFAELSSIDSSFSPSAVEAGELKARAADLAAAAADAAGVGDADPGRLSELESRMDRIARLKKKYGETVGEILEFRERAGRERDQLADLDGSLGVLQKREQSCLEDYRHLAEALSAKRTDAGRALSAAVTAELDELALSKARFRVAVGPREDASGPLSVAGVPRAVSPAGIDRATFLFAPNPGEPEQPLSRIASGGELARVQLALKTVLAAGAEGANRLYVFDEVDQGVSGQVAQAVGKKLAMLARRGQVFCVTHSPQIAALADRHFRAVKRTVRGRTVATLELLEAEERVREIARLIAGETITATAIEHARVLLSGGRRDSGDRKRRVSPR
jgi:DNA repair protein RecN (Recombination protein N)